MNTKSSLVLAGAVLTLCAQVSPGASATRSNTSRTSLERMPLLTIESDAGYTGAQTAGGFIPLSSEPWSARLVSGAGCASGFALAGAGATTGFSSPVDETAAVEWTFAANLVSTHADRATVDLHWTRLVHDPAVAPREPVDVTRRLELREGSRGVLDLVTADPSTGACESFAVIVGLKFYTERQAVDAAIAYDLWLIQRDPDGRETVDRFQAVGRQGEPVDYFFRPLLYAPDGTRADGDPRTNVALNVRGTLRGVFSGKDAIDLTVDGSRYFASKGATVGNQGRKRLAVRSGETIEFESPDPAGGTLPGVGNVASAFGRHRTAIRVTARVLWSSPASALALPPPPAP